MNERLETQLQFYFLVTCLIGLMISLIIMTDIHLIEFQPIRTIRYFFDIAYNLVIGTILIMLTVFAILTHLSIAKRFFWLIISIFHYYNFCFGFFF